MGTHEDGFHTDGSFVDDEDYDSFNEMIEEEDDEDPLGEALILLYHFLSILALKTDLPNEFLDMRSKLKVDRLDDEVIRANIGML